MTQRVIAERRAEFEKRLSLLAGMPLPFDMQIACDALADLDDADKRVAEQKANVESAYNTIADHVQRELNLHATISELEAENAALREVLERLIKEALVLQEAAEGCSFNHHSGDYEEFGFPPFLNETREAINRARETLRQTKGSRP